MCDPMSALTAASAVTSFVGQQQASDAYNSQAAAAHRDAIIAANNKYGDLQRRYVYDEKAANQEGFKAAMKARSEQGTIVASAGSNGTGGLTLDNLIAQSKQIGAENEARVQSRRDDLNDSLRSGLDSTRAEAQQRINSTPFKSGPNPLGLAINLAGAGVMGVAGANGLNPMKMTFDQFGNALKTPFGA